MNSFALFKKHFNLFSAYQLFMLPFAIDRSNLNINRVHNFYTILIVNNSMLWIDDTFHVFDIGNKVFQRTFIKFQSFIRNCYTRVLDNFWGTRVTHNITEIHLRFLLRTLTLYYERFDKKMCHCPNCQDFRSHITTDPYSLATFIRIQRDRFSSKIFQILIQTAVPN